LKIVTVYHKILEDGSKVVEIPLPGSKRVARLDEEGLSELIQLGLNPYMKFKQEFVHCRSGGRNIYVGRILCNCKAGENVRFIDGNVCNLTKGNMLKLNGMSLYGARDLIKKQHSRNRYEVEHIYDEQETKNN
jgi:hypothetical protein